MRSQIIKISFISVIMLFLGSCKKNDIISPNFTSLNYKLDDNVSASVKVCVYLDYGVFDACKTNTVNMLNEMQCNYIAINRDSILSGALDHYNLLLMPGGDMWQYNSYLSTAGMAKIRNYVCRGGGYIGICGGAYFAANILCEGLGGSTTRQY